MDAPVNGGRNVQRLLLAAFAACACAGLALVLGPGARPAVAASSASYKVLSAHLNVYEDGSFTASSGPVAWKGNGHHHDTLQAEGDLPPLPIGMSSHSKS